MLCTVYKNNNFTIKHEQFFDDEPAATWGELLERLENSLDTPDIFTEYDIAPSYYGNDYAVIEFAAWVNGAPRVYHLSPDMLEDYRNGKTVRFVYRENAPLFTLPEYFEFYPFTSPTTGRKGTLYKLVDPLSEDEKENMWNCEFFTTQAQYAPELKHTAVFVPAGVTFAFC